MKYAELPIDDLLARLHLASAQRIWRNTVERAENEGWTYKEFLAVLLVQELNHQQVTRLHHLSLQARLPFLKTCHEFDFSRVPACCQPVIERCLGREFVPQGRSLLLLGPARSGKTHLAVAIGYQALQHGRDVLYTTAAEMLTRLVRTSEQGGWSEAVARYTRPDVLIIDEVDAPTEHADLLYMALHERYLDGRPIVMAARRPVEKWGLHPHSRLLLSALLDRVLERGQILYLGDAPAAESAEAEVSPDDLILRTLPPSGPATDPAPPLSLAQAAKPATSRPPASGVERRRSLRYRVDLQIDASSEHNFFSGFCHDLSEGGLFIATHEFRPVGEIIDLTFQLPCGHTVRTSGVVRWQRVSPSEEDEVPGIGVEFLALSPDDTAAIKSFFCQREPLFHV